MEISSFQKKKKNPEINLLLKDTVKNKKSVILAVILNNLKQVLHKNK